MSIKRDILKGVRIFWSVLAVFCLLILGRIVQLQVSDMSDLSEKATKVEVKEMKFRAPRGQVYAENGYVLACSLSFFDLYMDCVVPQDSVFKADVKLLGESLAKLFKNKSAGEYTQMLKNARRKGKRYKRLGNRKLNYMEAEQVKNFPILKNGPNRGGIILKRNVLRYRPFGMLGERTIGKLAKNEKGVRVGLVGLEEAYESELKGVEGVKKVERAARYRVDYITEEAIDGNDVYTTLDIDIQDVAEKSLLESLQKFEAQHGTAVVMEVSTGEIKAMANLGIGRDSGYYEKRNYAVEDLVEPGSVFKLASMIALLEDGVVELSDSIETGRGVKRFYSANMNDFHACGKITVQQVFEKSSNIGVSVLVNNAYKKDPQKYIDRLYDLHLGDYLGLEIKNEAKPYIKEPSSKSWWGTSLPWMSVGYEVSVTPMHMLTLYNAVANGGVMVKPKLVTAIKRGGEVIRDFSEPIIIDDNICSKKTLQKLKIMLEGVVQRGTARNLQDTRYKIAGKTGTAHIAKPTGGYDLKNYRATFIGYFPADKPKYSCIVMVEKPNRKLGRFGGTVAAPVLKSIADELYAKGLLSDPLPLDSVVDNRFTKVNFVKTISDTKHMLEGLAIEKKLKPVAIANENKMPLLIGMSLRDALFVLEKKGLKVIIKGNGYVEKQSIGEKEKIVRGQTVTLYLS